jgi:hypothetical protein
MAAAATLGDTPGETTRMSQDREDAPPEPMIRFGNDWVPAHEAWKKMETATVAVEAIERFNASFPHLASDETREVVPVVKQRLKDITLRMPSRDPETMELGLLCAGFLEQMSPEDVLDRVQDEHGEALDLLQLIQLAGEDAYIRALGREAHEFLNNGISPDQTAQLWKDAQRPAPGGGLWTARKVEELLA